MGYLVQLEAQTREPGLQSGREQAGLGLLEKRWLLSALLRALAYLHATTPAFGESLIPLPNDADADGGGDGGGDGGIVE